jgi:hypothetical protein
MRFSRQPSVIQTMTDLKQLESVEYFNCFGSTITNDARCTCEIESGVSRAKIAINKKKALFTRKLDLNLRNKPVNRYIWSATLYGVENWKFLKLDKKYLVSFKTWCCRRMEKNRWTDRMRHEEVLHSV